MRLIVNPDQPMATIPDRERIGRRCFYNVEGAEPPLYGRVVNVCAGSCLVEWEPSDNGAYPQMMVPAEHLIALEQVKTGA